MKESVRHIPLTVLFCNQLAKDLLWLLDCSHKEGERKVHSSHLASGFCELKTFYDYLVAFTRKESVRHIALMCFLNAAG